MHIAWRVSILAFAILLPAAFNTASTQFRYRGTSVSHGGTVQGSVRLSSVPSQGIFDRITKDGAVCGKKKPSPRLCTGAGSGVKFAVVWIDGITQGKKGNPPGTATLRQRNCEYSPHVLILNPGDELEIVNEDPVLHNVHSYDVNNNLRSVFNIAQPVRGFHSHVRETDIAGINAMLTTCDAGHPWMSAYLVRASSPYYAVTDADGNFSLAGVPAGIYTLKMWHEGVTARNSTGGPGTPPVVEEPYVESRQITVRPDETVTVGFVLTVRAAVASQ